MSKGELYVINGERHVYEGTGDRGEQIFRNYQFPQRVVVIEKG